MSITCDLDVSIVGIGIGLVAAKPSCVKEGVGEGVFGQFVFAQTLREILLC